MWKLSNPTTVYEWFVVHLINSICISLMQEFNIFFHAYYNKIVSWSDRMEFVNGWYILIIVSDTLTIAGSALKIGIQTKVGF